MSVVPLPGSGLLALHVKALSIPAELSYPGTGLEWPLEAPGIFPLLCDAQPLYD